MPKMTQPTGISVQIPWLVLEEKERLRLGSVIPQQWLEPGPGQGLNTETFWKQSVEWCGQLVCGQPAPGCICPQAVVGGWVGDNGQGSYGTVTGPPTLVGGPGTSWL